MLYGCFNLSANTICQSQLDDIQMGVKLSTFYLASAECQQLSAFFGELEISLTITI